MTITLMEYELNSDIVNSCTAEFKLCLHCTLYQCNEIENLYLAGACVIQRPAVVSIFSAFYVSQIDILVSVETTLILSRLMTKLCISSISSSRFFLS